MWQKCQWHGSDWKLIVCFDSQQKCNQISSKAVTTIFTYINRLQITCIKLQRKKPIHVCVLSFFDRFWSETSVNQLTASETEFNGLYESYISEDFHCNFTTRFLKVPFPIHLFKYSVLTNWNYAKSKLTYCFETELIGLYESYIDLVIHY